MKNIVLQLVNVLGGLAVFLFGMKLMSDGLQKLAGDKLRKLLRLATSNRISATVCGALVTGIIQSSSATTIMTVGFVSAGLLTLTQALGVIFGANIGTTLTAWIVSIFGFKMDISLFALPVIALGFFIQFISKWVTLKRIGETCMGFGFLFFGLAVIKDAIPADLAQHPQVIELLARLRPDTLIHLLILIFSGTLLTVILQSSSAVMAMTLTCAAAGIIDFPTSCALVLGENIGTTVTANLAALGAGRTAKRAALGHTLFNTIGVLWAVLLFPYLLKAVDFLVAGNPYTADTAHLSAVLPYHISAFHTLFNVANTLLLLPLLPQLEKLTYLLLPKQKREEETGHELIYLASRLAPTPELSFIAAQKEMQRMLSFVSKITSKLIHALKTTDKKLFPRLIDDVKKAEYTTDVLEHKINSFLTQLTHGNLSRHAVAQSVTLFDILHSIEHMADDGEKIARILEKFEQKNAFNTSDKKEMEQAARLTKVILKRTQNVLALFQEQEKSQTLFEEALRDERALNALRKQLLRDRRERVVSEGKTDPDAITAYADILNHFEKMGDYALRITEHVSGKRAQDKDTSVHLSKFDTIKKEEK